jgi:hypothetical protein
VQNKSPSFHDIKSEKDGLFYIWANVYGVNQIRSTPSSLPTPIMILPAESSAAKFVATFPPTGVFQAFSHAIYGAP